MVKYRFVAGVQGRRARQKQRKGIKLRDAGVTVPTQERYYVAVREVLKFFDKSISFPQVDELIADWIEKKFESGYPLNGVADCLSGIHYFMPLSRRQLPCSWKLFSIWRKIEVPSRALTEDLLFAFATRALMKNDLEFASLLLLGIHCFLRTGELLAVTAESLLVSAKTGIVCVGGSPINSQKIHLLLNTTSPRSTNFSKNLGSPPMAQPRIFKNLGHPQRAQPRHLKNLGPHPTHQSKNFQNLSPHQIAQPKQFGPLPKAPAKDFSNPGPPPKSPAKTFQKFGPSPNTPVKEF